MLLRSTNVLPSSTYEGQLFRMRLRHRFRPGWGSEVVSGSAASSSWHFRLARRWRRGRGVPGSLDRGLAGELAGAVARER